MHRLTIKSDGPQGFGTETQLDGAPVHGLTGIDLHIGVGEATRAELSVLLMGVSHDGQAEVAWSVQVAGHDSPATGHGDTLAAALRSLADELET